MAVAVSTQVQAPLRIRVIRRREDHVRFPVVGTAVAPAAAQLVLGRRCRRRAVR